MILHKILHQKKNSRIFLGALCAVLVFITTCAEAAPRRRQARTGGGYAPPYAAIVVDMKTGKVLHEDNADARRYPASITKVMTLYLLFEQLEAGKIKLQTRIPVSAYAASQPPSKLGLRAGETISVQEAIGALVTKSANDAAVVVAEAIAGSEQKFAKMMTYKARSLGMKNTVFRNPHGLPNSSQYTTARDLATLGRAIQERFPVYYKFFQTRSFAYKNGVHANHNKLLGRVEGVDGIKTGYTNASGFNLLTSAKFNNRQIVAVILGGKSGYARDQAMTRLVGSYLPVAYAGKRTAPAIKETRVAQINDDANTIQVKNDNPGEPLKLHNVRAVVTASLDTPSATTPSFVDKRVIQPNNAKLPKGVYHFASLPIDSSGNILSKPNTTDIKSKGSSKPAENVGNNTKTHARIAEAKMKSTPEKPKAVEISNKIDGWVIQLAATGDENSAKVILDNAKSKSGKVLVQAEPFTEKFERDGSIFYRARFSGFAERKDALSACSSLKKSGFSCFASRS